MLPTKDYRQSHEQRGDSYDAFIATTRFDAYMADWEAQHVAMMVRQMFPGGVPRYLDFACGTGRLSAIVAPLAQESIGVDISASMLAQARKKLSSMTFLEHDLTRERPPIGVFDLVTAFRFFGNAQDQLRDEGLKAIVDHMKPGAHLIINNHRNPRALSAILDKLTGGDAQGMDLHMGKLRGLLRRHGLTIRREQPIGAWMFRSRLLNAFRPDDQLALRYERRFSSGLWASIAPDVIVVAQKS